MPSPGSGTPSATPPTGAARWASAWTPATRSPQVRTWPPSSRGSRPSPAGSTWCTATTRATSSGRAATGTLAWSRARSTRPCSSTSSGSQARPPSARRRTRPPTCAGCAQSSASQRPDSAGRANGQFRPGGPVPCLLQEQSHPRGPRDQDLLGRRQCNGECNRATTRRCTAAGGGGRRHETATGRLPALRRNRRRRCRRRSLTLQAEARCWRRRWAASASLALSLPLSLPLTRGRVRIRVLAILATRASAVLELARMTGLLLRLLRCHLDPLAEARVVGCRQGFDLQVRELGLHERLPGRGRPGATEGAADAAEAWEVVQVLVLVVRPQP